MPHLEVRVDGEIRYDGEVAEQYLPQRAEMFPRALGAQGAPNVAPTPLAKLMMLTALVDLVMKALESPMLQPLSVGMQTRGMGCMTLTIDTPVPPSAPVRGAIAL